MGKYDDTGDVIIDGWTNVEKTVIHSEEGPYNDITKTVFSDKEEAIYRYDSNRADDEN